ncbi:MAG TPA: class I SAM-dependent methyltransferase [Anaerolineales bacterium]
MPLIRRRFDRDYFNSAFHRAHAHSPRNTQRLKLIMKHKRGGRLLEIGTGGGDFLERVAPRFDVRAIDISPYAGSRLPQALRERITVGNIEELALPASAYDVITVFNVLEHLRQPTEAIRKLVGALAPDGILVGSMPCNAGWLGSTYTKVTEFFDRTHISCYKVSAWREAFDAAGLPDTRFFGEVLLDGLFCLYIFTPRWPHLSLNLMFLARKQA